MLETVFSSGISDERLASLLDVDFSLAARAAGRRLGATPRLAGVGMAGVERYFNVRQVYPESQIRDLIAAKNERGGMIRPLVRSVKDQDGEPSCVSNAFLSAHEVKQCELLGPDLITQLSPISLYMRVGSRSSGSSLDDNMREMLTTGALPLKGAPNSDKFAHSMSHNGYGQRYPDGWKTTAAAFKNGEYADIENLLELLSALIDGHPVIYARSGHCILAIGAAYRSSSLILEYLNSWGDWGAALNEHFAYGVGFDSERVARSAAYGAMALLSVQVPFPFAIAA